MQSSLVCSEIWGKCDNSEMIPRWAFMIMMEIRPRCLSFPSPTILPTEFIQHPTKANHLPLLLYFTSYHYHKCIYNLKIQSSHWRKAEFSQGQRMNGMWHIAIGLNLRVKMENLGWMNMLHSGIRKVLWKGFHSMPAIECGRCGPNVACEDAVSKQIFIHYIGLHFGVMGWRIWGLITNRKG